MAYRVFLKQDIGKAYVRQDDHRTADDLYLLGWTELPDVVELPGAGSDSIRVDERYC